MNSGKISHGAVNHDLINDLYDTLNRTKGFEVSMTSPSSGTLHILHNGVLFHVEATALQVDATITDARYHFMLGKRLGRGVNEDEEV